MNFPGLDLAWTYGHHAGHALRIVRTWSLVETRAAVERKEKILVVATTALLAAAADHAGLKHSEATILGACLSLSSTAIVLELLSNQERLKSNVGRAAFSVLTSISNDRPSRANEIVSSASPPSMSSVSFTMTVLAMRPSLQTRARRPHGRPRINGSNRMTVQPAQCHHNGDHGQPPEAPQAFVARCEPTGEHESGGPLAG